MKYIKLVASDLDGTLLDKNKEITPRLYHALEQMNEQAGKRKEKHFSLHGIRLPKLRLPHLDGPTWAVLLMGTAALLLLWWGLDTVWSSLSLLLP